MTEPNVEAVLRALPLARLTHFTPSRNLPHIVRNGLLRSVADMNASARACYTPTDRLRLDGHLDKVCCSLQYPNSFYFHIARDTENNYPDWVCLFIDKQAAAATGTRFCPRNAAAGGGVPGADALLSCYNHSVVGQGGKTRTRGSAHDPSSPTDVQAEVLLAAPVALSLVRAIVFPTADAAREEHGRLNRLGLAVPPTIKWKVSPGMFDKWTVSNAVTASRYFPEQDWVLS